MPWFCRMLTWPVSVFRDHQIEPAGWPVVSTASTSETPRPTCRGLPAGGGPQARTWDDWTANSLLKKTDSVPASALRTTRSVKPSPFRSAAMICAGSRPVASEPTSKATVAIGVERDRVIVSIDTGEDRALIRIRNPGDVARRIAGIDRDGGLEGARLAGYGLSKEDVPGAVDDRHVGHAVAIQVGDEGRVLRNEADRPGLANCRRPGSARSRRSWGVSRRDGQVGAAVAGEVARRDDGRVDLASELERRHDWNPPWPSPWSRETELALQSATARSSGPPPKKFPVVIDKGASSVPRGIDGWRANVPLPSPSRIDTLSGASEEARDRQVEEAVAEVARHDRAW